MNLTKRIMLLAVVAVALVSVGQRRRPQARQPHLKTFRRQLAERYGAATADRVAARAGERFEELFAGRELPEARALQVHLEHGILPGLAIYQAMLTEGMSREMALREAQSLIDTVVDPMRSVMRLLGRLPRSFALFRRLEPLVVRLGFPADGWEMVPVANDEESVAFSVRRCYYLDTLTAYGAPELTPVYCRPDDVVFAELAPGVTWERTKTLGRGYDECDFRWCRGARAPKMARAGGR